MKIPLPQWNETSTAGKGNSVIDRLFKGLSSLERGGLGSGNLDGLLGPRVSARPCGPFFHLEGSEANKGHRLALS